MNKQHKQKGLLLTLVVITLVAGGCLASKVWDVYQSQQAYAQVMQEFNELTDTLAEKTAQANELQQQFNDSLTTEQPLAKKVAFLTFDDGPGERTEEILAILKAYDVQATFFVAGYRVEQYPEQMAALVAAGQKIGSHTYSHQYKTIYQSLANFQADFAQADTLIQTYTGEPVRLFRHPGGSSTGIGTPGVVAQTCQWLTETEVNYIDWNVDSMDASGHHVPVSVITDAVLTQAEQQSDVAVILMHDTQEKDTTAQALPHIIEGLQAEGYVFEGLPDGAHFVQHRKS